MGFLFEAWGDRRSSGDERRVRDRRARQESVDLGRAFVGFRSGRCDERRVRRRRARQESVDPAVAVSGRLFVNRSSVVAEVRSLERRRRRAVHGRKFE